jgi:hypothetical protein
VQNGSYLHLLLLLPVAVVAFLELLRLLPCTLLLVRHFDCDWPPQDTLHQPQHTKGGLCLVLSFPHEWIKTHLNCILHTGLSI